MNHEEHEGHEEDLDGTRETAALINAEPFFVSFVSFVVQTL
jgi:hypothetical protein